jgi:hypothetical protein
LNSSSLLQSGVSEVIYFVEKSLSDSDIAYIASHKLLSMAGVKVSLPLDLSKCYTEPDKTKIGLVLA